MFPYIRVRGRSSPSNSHDHHSRSPRKAMPEASSSRRPSSGLDRRTGASASASKSPQKQDSAEVEEDLSQARGQAEASDGGEDDDDDEEEGVYEVERIINHKVTSKNGRIKLLVKWTGYDNPEDNTWEYEVSWSRSGSVQSSDSPADAGDRVTTSRKICVSQPMRS